MKRHSLSANKKLAITLSSSWVMTCCMSKQYEYVASGGLDNVVTVFKTSDNTTNEAIFKKKVRAVCFTFCLCVCMYVCMCVCVCVCVFDTYIELHIHKKLRIYTEN